MQQVMLIEYPYSQTCMNCGHGRLLATSLDCICIINSDKNLKGHCKDFEESLRVKERRGKKKSKKSNLFSLYQKQKPKNIKKYYSKKYRSLRLQLFSAFFNGTKEKFKDE